MTQKNADTKFNGIDPEQLPVESHKLKNWKHFAGICEAEHVATTEFIIGATFVALGVKTKDLLLGLLIRNIISVLSWFFITSPTDKKELINYYLILNRNYNVKYKKTLPIHPR